MIKEDIIKMIKGIMDINVPLVSNLANFSKIIYDKFEGTCWAGFYLCDDDFQEMYLGPFQGPVACTKIKYQNGVCGACATKRQSIIVPDVHKFPGHIACYSLSNSEIVVPIVKNNQLVAIIDLDSTNFDNYHEDDKILLENIASIISEIF